MAKSPTAFEQAIHDIIRDAYPTAPGYRCPICGADTRPHDEHECNPEGRVLRGLSVDG